MRPARRERRDPAESSAGNRDLTDRKDSGSWSVAAAERRPAGFPTCARAPADLEGYCAHPSSSAIMRQKTMALFSQAPCVVWVCSYSVLPEVSTS